MQGFLGKNEENFYDNIALYADESTTWMAWELLRQRAIDDRLAGHMTSAADLKKTMWGYAMKKAYALKQIARERTFSLAA